MSLEELEAVLVASKEQASAFTKSLEGAERTAEEVEHYINHTQTITLEEVAFTVADLVHSIIAF